MTHTLLPKKRRLFLPAVLAAAWVFPCPLRADANLPATIVQTPVAPTLDGTDADWTGVASEQPILATDGKKVGSFKLSYDSENLYAFVKVTDDSPLRNTSTKLQEIMKGGDAIGLMFGPVDGRGTNQRVLVSQVDGKSVVMVYRPVSAEKKPYAFTSPVSELKMDYVAPLAQAGAAFKVGKNEYAAEIRLPRASLGIAPADGKSMPFDVQVIFSDPAGTTNTDTAWWHTRGGDSFTVEDLPTEAKLNPDGWGVATFTAQNPSPKTDVAVEAPAPASVGEAGGATIDLNLPRDGRLSVVVTDDTGWIVRELAEAESVKAGRRKIDWDGRDRYGEPLPPGRYGWRALLFDGMGTRFYGSVGNSGRPPYRTADGMGSEGGQHGVPAGLAADAGGIYLLGATEEGHPGMRKVDARTGAALWKRSYGGFGAGVGVAAGDGMACLLNRSGKPQSRTLDLVRIDPATGKDVPMGTAPARLALPDGKADVGGLAIAGGRAYFSVPANNQVQVVDLYTGQTLDPIHITKPQGVCRLDDHALLVVSESNVLELNVEGNQTRPLLQHLIEPRAVAVDEQGALYVSDLGPAQQIKKFDRAGKLLDTFGRAGGKPAEMLTYDPLAFKNISGLTVGPDGSLWLCESSAPPKRFVKMTRDGKWVEDVCGPVAYNTFGIDLDDVSTVYYNTDSTQLVETKLDYAHYQADPNDPAAGWKITALHDLTQKGDVDLMSDVADAGYGHLIVFKGTDGRRYLFRLSKFNRGSRLASGAGLWRWDGRWVPAAFLSRDETKFGQAWCDTNGDGMVQKDERFSLPPSSDGYAWIDRDLKLYGFEGVVAPTGMTPQGVPLYVGAKTTPHIAADEAKYHGDQNRMVSAPAEDGSIYYAVNVGPHRHLSPWDRASENRIVKFKNGKAQWVVGQHDARAPGAAMTTVSGIAGIVDDVVIAHIVEPANYIAFTSDGMTLGNVLVDATGKRPSVGPNAIYIESFTGLFIKDPATGKRLLLSVSSGDDRILEVTGPGKTDSFKGDVTLTSARPREAFAAKVAIPYQPFFGNTETSQRVDGQDYEWRPETRGIPIRDATGTVAADVRLRRDGGSLNVIADVLDRTPLEDGEGVELMLSKSAGASDSSAVRLTLSAPLTPFDVPAAADNKKKPAGVTIERLSDDSSTPKKEMIAGSKIAAVARWRGLGYRVEAEIPLAVFPDLTTETEQTFRRGTKTDGRAEVKSVKEKRPDFTGPVGLNAAVLFKVDGAIRRRYWVEPSTVDAAPDSTKTAWGTAEPVP